MILVVKGLITLRIIDVLRRIGKHALIGNLSFLHQYFKNKYIIFNENYLGENCDFNHYKTNYSKIHRLFLEPYYT